MKHIQIHKNLFNQKSLNLSQMLRNPQKQKFIASLISFTNIRTIHPLRPVCTMEGKPRIAQSMSLLLKTERLDVLKRFMTSSFQCQIRRLSQLAVNSQWCVGVLVYTLSLLNPHGATTL